MNLLSPVRTFHNSKLFFSKNELTKILSCYSTGVSKGKWKDYAILFKKHEASFYMFKHSLANPDCILTKYTKTKKQRFAYKLEFNNKRKNQFNQIDELLALLKRSQFKIFKEK